MALRGTPDHAFGPLCKLAQFLDFLVTVGGVVWQRQAAWIENFHFASHCLEQASGFECQ